MIVYMDFIPLIFTLVLVILVIVLSVVGVQLILVLTELRRTLKKVNTTLDVVETKVVQFVSPFQNLGGALAGFKTGLQVFDTFAKWFNREKNEKA
jgi:hypothetical protein